MWVVWVNFLNLARNWSVLFSDCSTSKRFVKIQNYYTPQISKKWLWWFLSDQVASLQYFLSLEKYTLSRFLNLPIPPGYIDKLSMALDAIIEAASWQPSVWYFVCCMRFSRYNFCSFLTTSVLRNLHHLSAPSKHQFMQCAGGHLSHLQIDLWKEDVWSSAPWIARILPHHWGELNYQAGNARLIAVRCLQLLLYIICLPLLAKQIIVRSFDIF